MKHIFTLFLFTLLASVQLLSQDRTTYPVDSCLYFMDPFNFRILQKFDLPNGTQGNQSLFRSTGSPNILIQGKGVWIIDPGELPIPLEQGDQGQFLMTVPETPAGGGWPGGQPPYPIVLYGFLTKVGTTIIDPPIPMTMRVRQVFFEDTTQ